MELAHLADVKGCKQTIHNILNDDIGVQCSNPRKTITLKPSHKIARLNWARNHARDNFENNVIWSDENKIV